MSAYESDTNQNLITGSKKDAKLPSKQKTEKPKDTKPIVDIKSKGDVFLSASSSHTKYYRKAVTKNVAKYEQINSDQYMGQSESISDSSESFGCYYGPEGKKYTPEGQLKRNLARNLDPIKLPPEWTEECPLTQGWELAATLAFLVTDEVGAHQIDRIQAGIVDLLKLASPGFPIDALNDISTIINFLVENYIEHPSLKQGLDLLLELTQKPLHLTKNSDILTYFDDLSSYFGFLGFLLQSLEDEQQFALCARGLVWQLSAADSERGAGTVHRRNALAAAYPMLLQPVSYMLALAKSSRYAIFLEIALLMTCEDEECCMQIINEQILENMFYRFNPYFPARLLPTYDVGPQNPQDPRVKLGDCSVHIDVTLSLLLVLLKTANSYLDLHPEKRLSLPCPDDYAQRCFIWAFRYECRAREHQHERNTFVAVTMLLLNCFRERLSALGNIMMPDILSLAVLTELPGRQDWTSSVNFNTAQRDVQFKKMLIHLSVYFIKIFPENGDMIAQRHWVVGLMYLLDPGLSRLRAHWSPALFAEIRTTSLQALVCALRFCPSKMIQKCGLIRRIMWYIEWYSECAFEISILYWCMRLLYAAMRHRRTDERRQAVKDLLDSHGVIIIIKLCETLLDQKQPPVEKSQAVIGLCLRLLTSSVETKRTVTCCVYPTVKWPSYINHLIKRMLSEVLTYLDKCYIISYRWLVALLNFIWEGIVWKPRYRHIFLNDNGVYKLLDLITVTKPPVQCLALAILCDLTRAGGTIAQLITWRASFAASKAHPNLVKRGATIASLLAAVFRDDCKLTGVHLDEYDVIQDLDHPIMSKVMLSEIQRERFVHNINHRTSTCLAAGEMSGSRMSKAYAILHMLSEDFSFKVEKVDETYNLYKNVKLPPNDEVVLQLCAHYLTLKLSEAWIEVEAQKPTLMFVDEGLLIEFLNLGRGWAKEIKFKQEKIILEERHQDQEEENSLYSFLGRVRLNIALDALRDVCCVARTADRDRILHVLLHEAVRAHHRKSDAGKHLTDTVLKTYAPPLDDENITGQYVKILSISNKAVKKHKVQSRPSSPVHAFKKRESIVPT